MRTLAILFLALALPAHAQIIPLPISTDTTVQADPNYAAALNASLAVVQAQTDAQKAIAEAKASCYAALATIATSNGGSETSRVAAAVALGISCATYGGSQINTLPPSAQIPAPPVQVQSGNWMQALVNAPAALLDGAVRLGPTIVQYLLGVAQTKSNTAIQLAQSAERAGLYQTFGAMNQSGLTAVQNVANQGFITVGLIPHTNNYTITNSNGVGFGSGNITYNPVANSYNPIRTCSGGTAGSATPPAVPGGGGAATC